MHFFRSGSATGQNGEEGEPAYIFASKQKIYSKRKKPVSGILLLPSIARALVLSNSTTSVFTMPEFAPSAGVSSMRDVNDFSAEADARGGSQEEIDVTIFSKTAIRVVSVGPDRLSLAHTVDYPGALAGVRRAGFALVGTKERYDLVDVRNSRRIGLFPISSMQADEEQTPENALKPMVQPVVGDEFLVTCGTRPQDPAMGMVVNADGDISRGTIPWMEYPTSVAVDYPFVAAVVGKQVQIHSVLDQSLVFSAEYDSVPLVSRVAGSYEMPYLPLVEKLRLVPLCKDDDHKTNDEIQSRLERERASALKLATVSSSIMVYSIEKGVQCFVPAPRVVQLQRQVAANDMDKVVDELSTFEVSSERAFVEFEYMNLLVAVHYLKMRSFDDAFPAWLQGQYLDPRIVVFAFEQSAVRGNLWLFNGIRVLLEDESFVTLKEDQDARKFFSSFLRAWLAKRDMESIQDKESVFSSVELATLHQLLRHGDQKALEEFIAKDVVESVTDAKEVLRNENWFVLLARLHERLGERREQLQVWKTLIDDTVRDSHMAFTNGPETMRKFLVSCDDRELVWEYGLWLAEQSPVEGSKVFESPDRAVQFDDSEVVAALKELQDDTAWRHYLKYLVYERQSTLYVSDLALFLVDEVVEKLSRNKQLARHVKESYAEYRALAFPKPSYVGYLRGVQAKLSVSSAASAPMAAIVKSRLDLLGLLESQQDFDVSAILRRVEEDAADTLVMELCVLYGRLSLHGQCLDVLCNTLRDYRTALLYCQYGVVSEELHRPDERATLPVLDVELRRNLCRGLFQRFLAIEDESTRREFTSELLSKWGHLLDLNFVLSKTPDTWPVETLETYLTQTFRDLLQQKSASEFERALSRGDCLFLKQQLHEVSKMRAPNGPSS